MNSNYILAIIQFKMKLKPRQVKLFNKLIKFIKNKEDKKQFLLEGEGGAGKTFCVSYTLLKLILKKYFNSCNLHFIAPTNAAKKVLRKTIQQLLNNDSDAFVKYKKHMNKDRSISYNTIHSFFKSKRTYDEEGNQRFEIIWNKSVMTEMMKEQIELQKHDPSFKPNKKDLIILDEVSMLDPEKYNLFQKLLEQYPKTKIIYMGDRNQLSYVDTSGELKELNYLSPVFTDVTEYFLLKGNERTDDEKITKIINKAKKCVINNKFKFTLTKKDLSKNVKVITDKELLNDENIIDFIKENKPKILTYSNKRRDRLNNQVRNMIYTKDNIYIDRYLYLEGEEIIFENTYMLDSITYHNTDEAKVKSVKYDIMERVSFLGLFSRMFLLQKLELEGDPTQLYQIGKEHLPTFELMTKILKKCVKDFFGFNPNRAKFTSKPSCKCEFCNEKRTSFKTYYNDKEKICQGCYMKVRQYIKKRFFCKSCNRVEMKNHNCSYAALSSRNREKKFIFNEMFESICDLENKYNLPVAYSYAITVYKSQGSTYENVIIDYDNIYMCNKTSIKNLTRALYVAVSRVQKRLWFLNYSYHK